MENHLLNIREAAGYLGISERRMKELVDAGEIPAYRIGGAFLRFKEGQLAIIKSSLQGKTEKDRESREPEEVDAGFSRFRDFLYFNDFYILSIVIIVIAVVLMVAT